MNEYVNYCNFSEYARKYEQVFQKRTWVPKWLWSLIAQPYMTAEQISEELKTANQILINQLLKEANEQDS